MRILDLFAGIGGWDLACRDLGWEADGVEKWADALATRDAAGLTTIHDDVLTYRGEPGSYDLVLGSPPCQTFSIAGKGSGRRGLDAIQDACHSYVYRHLYDHPIAASDLALATGDERTGLVLEPLRVCLEIMPEFIAWEQVPPVLPVWEMCAWVLRQHGYSTATGCVTAEQFGVPQTRKRAVLVASREGAVHLPVATHSKFHSTKTDQMDLGTMPWVSMAEALGWGMTHRPYPAIAPGTAAGGTDPQAIGGSGSRRGITAERDAGRWVDKPWDDGPETWNRPFVHANFTGRLTPASNPSRNDGARISINEAAVLQSFPADFPWQGAKSSQYQQVGNAIPPLMARAILKQLTA